MAKALDVDAVMLRPTADDLIVFKLLAHVHPDEVRARFALLKYLNKVVTPLLQVRPGWRLGCWVSCVVC